MAAGLATVVAHIARQVAGTRVLAQGTVQFTPSIVGGADLDEDPAVLLTVDPVTGMIIDGQLYSPDSIAADPDNGITALLLPLQLAAEDLVTGQSLSWTAVFALADVDDSRQPADRTFTLTAGETFDLITMRHGTGGGDDPDPDPGVASVALGADPDGTPVVTVDGTTATITADADGTPVLTLTDQAAGTTLSADTDGTPLLTTGA